ncbi:ppp1, partial [Symbiodinium sp. KB8]
EAISAAFPACTQHLPAAMPTKIHHKGRLLTPGYVKPKKRGADGPITGARRLSRMGKKQQKGKDGLAVQYVTRAKALKKLQLTLPEFRRLCILKGIYPRDPPKVSEGRQQTYYHYKDIRFLAHEPLLEKFRSISAYMKKVNKVAHKGAVDLARRMYARRPEYTLDHLVRERYPRFQDAVADLDDALCMAHLYATLPGDKRYVEPAVTAKAALLCKQWALWVSRTRSLRKVFLTIKGVYYQASVCGQDVTWLVPYKFVQGLPDDVDFPVMNTFMEFYDVMLRFTMFKLYHDIGLQFPPPEVAAAADAGAFLGALHPQALGTQNSTGVPASTAVTPVSAGGAAADAVPLDRSVARAAAAAAA